MSKKKVELQEFQPHAFEHIYCDISEEAESLEVSFSLPACSEWKYTLATDGLASFQEGLWQHTCFEVFEFNEDDESYVEWNFSPNGNWFFKAFSNYRKEKPLAEVLKPENFEVCERDSALELSVKIPKSFSSSAIQLNAVLEDPSAKLRYFARFHPDHQPDFHLRLLE